MSSQDILVTLFIKFVHLSCPEALFRSCSTKSGRYEFHKIHGKHLSWRLFLTKSQVSRLILFKQCDSNTFFFPLDFLEIIKNRHFCLKPLHKCFWLSSLPKLHNNLAVDFKLCQLSFSNSDQN